MLKRISLSVIKIAIFQSDLLSILTAIFQVDLALG